MKKRLMIGAILAGSLALTGCTSTCDDMANGFEAFEEKAKPCLSAGEEPTAFNVNQCENNLERCSDSEKEALGKYADCLRDLPECTPSTRESFGNALMACALTAQGKIGENCATIFDN